MVTKSTSTVGTKTKKTRVKKVKPEEVAEVSMFTPEPTLEEVAKSSIELPKGGNENFLKAAKDATSDIRRFFWRRQYLLSLPEKNGVK